MLIRPIFRTPWLKSQNPRGRRPRAGCSLELESLENRTPLSAGLTAPAESALVVQAVDIALFFPGRTLELQWASLEAAEQPTISAQASVFALDFFMNALPSTIDLAATAALEGPAPAPANSAIAEEITPGIPPSGFGATLVTGATEAFGQSGAAGGSPVRPSNDPSGMTIVSGFDQGGVGDALSHFDGDADPPLPFGYLMGVAQFRANGQPTNSDDDTDMSFAGTLDGIDTVVGSSPWTTTAMSGGRAAGRLWNILLTEPLAQVDASGEVPAPAGCRTLRARSGSTSTLPLQPPLLTTYSPGKTARPSPFYPLRSPRAGFLSMCFWVGPMWLSRTNQPASSRSPFWFRYLTRRSPWPQPCGRSRRILATSAPDADAASAVATDPARNRTLRRPGRCS